MSDKALIKDYRGEMAFMLPDRPSRLDHVLISVAGDRFEITTAEWRSLPEWAGTIAQGPSVPKQTT